MSTSEFEQAVLMQGTAPPAELFYRLYYNAETSEPVCMSMEKLDMPFFELSKEDYLSGKLERFRIQDGQLKRVDPAVIKMLKLRKSPSGEFTTIPGNMMFLANTGDKYTVNYE